MKERKDPDTRPWYVLCHLNPRQIETLLRKDSRGELRDRNSRDAVADSPYRFYIPYVFMPTAETLRSQEASSRGGSAADSVARNRELRHDLHNFVFIQASAERVDRIVTSPWNTMARLHLYYYRDHEGHKVVVPDADMSRLRKTIQDQHFLFYFDQPITDFSPESEVILNIEPWTGQRGVIKKITVRKQQLCMDISMNIFNRTKSINFVDLRTGDIAFVDARQQQLLGDDVITSFEENVVELLSHRYTRTASDRDAEKDAVTLKRLSAYYNIYVDDDAEQARFLSLRLIYASLRQWERQVADLVSQASGLLKDPCCAADADDAYLMTALFIATRQARWREAVKTYRNTHPDSPDILRRYHTIVKHIKAKPSPATVHPSI